jgi:hypothetical protein
MEPRSAALVLGSFRKIPSMTKSLSALRPTTRLARMGSWVRGRCEGGCFHSPSLIGVLRRMRRYGHPGQGWECLRTRPRRNGRRSLSQAVPKLGRPIDWTPKTGRRFLPV